MAVFRTATVEQLAHELTLAPARYRARHIEGAARAIELMRSDQEYARSFLVFQITGYRPRSSDDIELSGRDLIADTARLIEKLSLISPQDRPANETLFDAAALCARWDVSGKTLERWRGLGLVARWFDSTEGPTLLFLLRDVERFEQAHAERLRRARTYRRLDEGEREKLVQRAIDVMAERGCGLVAAAQAVAGETGRSVETIRVAVRRAQSGSTPDVESETTTTPNDAESMLASHRAGQSVADLARHFRISQKEIRGRLTRGRAMELLRSRVKYLFAPEFDHPEAERTIFTDSRSDDEPAEPDRVPEGLPPYLRELCSEPLLSRSEERDLFRRYNYLLHRAEMARRMLDVETATDTAMDHMETLLARALTIKNRILHANQRLVISIAKKHLGRVPGLDLPDLISEGNVALMRAAEGFDFSRGHRFSTYATWSVSRAFSHSVAAARGHCEHFQTGYDEPWAGVESDECPDPVRQAADVEAASALREVLCELDAREREIVERRFGLNDAPVQTLAEVSDSIRISRERVRQIEAKTLLKLRHALEQRGVAAAAS